MKCNDEVSAIVLLFAVGGRAEGDVDVAFGVGFGVDPVQEIEHPARQGDCRAYDFGRSCRLSGMYQKSMNVLYGQVFPRSQFALFDVNYSDATLMSTTKTGRGEGLTSDEFLLQALSWPGLDVYAREARPPKSISATLAGVSF